MQQYSLIAMLPWYIQKTLPDGSITLICRHGLSFEKPLNELQRCLSVLLKDFFNNFCDLCASSDFICTPLTDAKSY